MAEGYVCIWVGKFKVGVEAWFRSRITENVHIFIKISEYNSNLGKYEMTVFQNASPRTQMS